MSPKVRGDHAKLGPESGKDVVPDRVTQPDPVQQENDRSRSLIPVCEAGQEGEHPRTRSIDPRAVFTSGSPRRCREGV